MKEIIHRLDFIKVKNIYSTKNTLDRMRRQSTEWEKIFTEYISDKGPLFKTHKES